MRIFAFAKRNFKELLKSPINYVFSLGFPLLMIILFAIINHFIQTSFAEQAGNLSGDALNALLANKTTTFEMKNNAPAMAFFGLTFIMLNVTLLVAKDKSSSFLLRLYSTPMKMTDFVIGYALPSLFLCIVQQFLCYGVAEIVGVIEGANFGGGTNTFNFIFAILAVISQIPSMIIFVSLGILFGILLGEKGAPPCVSIFINFAGIFGGCYFPLNMLSGLAVFAKCFPFYPQVLLSQTILSETTFSFENFWIHLIVVTAYTIFAVFATFFAFSYKMRSDNK